MRLLLILLATFGAGLVVTGIAASTLQALHTHRSSPVSDAVAGRDVEGRWTFRDASASPPPPTPGRW
ncbi:MAG: hypothetical protein KIT25_13855 [Enhydrobacter sp.]|nr:MAG: hypothetical protein KIT25_13855 [Enhydrobacter sp.]